uniref:Uncharacterized protein n=1 Tax=Arundo donax TaxID=35708 RepID=A0A0A9GYQ6_ARUDO
MTSSCARAPTTSSAAAPTACSAHRRHRRLLQLEQYEALGGRGHRRRQSFHFQVLLSFVYGPALQRGPHRHSCPHHRVTSCCGVAVQMLMHPRRI